MNPQISSTNPSMSSQVRDKSPGHRQTHPLWAYRGVAVWLVFGGFMLLMMWPMLKGGYYRMGGPAPADGITWRTDYAAALAESRETGKPLLLDFTAPWCPPCVVMKHEVWPEPEVRDAITANYIPVLLDVDEPGSAEVARRYGVHSIPAIFVVNGDGGVLRTGFFMNKGQMLEFLTTPASAG